MSKASTASSRAKQAPVGQRDPFEPLAPTSSSSAFRVVSSLTGRVRFHAPDVLAHGAATVEHNLRSLSGVRSCQANPHTDNILITYDPASTTEQGLLERLTQVKWHEAVKPHRLHTQRPTVLHEKAGRLKRIRIPVTGLDRNPDLARELVEKLESRPGVKASASPLTGRVLVEFASHVVEAAEVIAEVAHFDAGMAPLPDEDRPLHPLDPGPLVQTSVRSVGASLGLITVAATRLMGATVATSTRSQASHFTALMGLAQSFPGVRKGLRSVLGRSGADLLYYAPVLVGLVLSDGILGLALTAAESTFMLSEVITRRSAFKRYEERLSDDPAQHAGAIIRLDAGQRPPRRAVIIEGTGLSVGRDGTPKSLAPGSIVSAGSRLTGGPFVCELQGQKAFDHTPRPVPPRESLLDRYTEKLNLASLAYAATMFLTTGSPARALESLMLVNPRPALIGSELASVAADQRVMRAGVVVVGTRPDRHVRLPNYLLLECARMLTDGYELASVHAFGDFEGEDLLARGASVLLAAGNPWGNLLGTANAAILAVPAADGSFDGKVARASIDGVEHTVEMLTDRHLPASRAVHAGESAILVRQGERIMGFAAVRPRLQAGVADLVAACRAHEVQLAVLSRSDGAASKNLARRAGIDLLEDVDAITIIREWQRDGARVAYATDHLAAAEPFWAADLSIGMSAGRGIRFPARADLLAPDVAALAAIIEAGARREKASRDAVGFSLVANLVGAVLGARGAVGIERASQTVYLASMAALGNAVWKLRGGERSRPLSSQLVDPRPERWARRTLDDVLKTLGGRLEGLTETEALARRQQVVEIAPHSQLLPTLIAQFRTPIPGILATAAVVALLADAPLDFALIVATMGVNMLIGTWQEYKTGQAAEALQMLSSPVARVLRDGQPMVLPAREVVVGDILVLAPGDRIAADARVLEANGLEADEASLTGESHPVAKTTNGSNDMARIVLAGTDVISGSGRALVVAVGRKTRYGATAAALALDEVHETPLGKRIGGLFARYLPLSLGGGVLVAASGLIRGIAPASFMLTGASVALASLPEGLPLLSGVGQAAVARRLAGRKAVVRRLAAIEALGRVDVTCTDKTGTLTEGRLRVAVLATSEAMVDLPSPLDASMAHLLEVAALACPRPDSDGATAHLTDVSVVRAARDAGLGDRLLRDRDWDVPFAAGRGFYACHVDGKVCVKGAPEVLLPLCTRVGGPDSQALTPEKVRQMLARTEELAARGLRVLLVAEGPAQQQGDTPKELTALGWIGLADPLRPTAALAVARCQQAGIRVIILTGDHPLTARAIAREVGLAEGPHAIVTAHELAELDNGALDRRLAEVTVIARATPLDKLRIIETLQRQGHVVAMTGDGVNDAPALRLADVGVAMGKGGTQVAQHSADVILEDDDFSTLVEALLEGRSFWRNMRRSIGLLLGGNLGELGLVVAATTLGFASPLSARQILAVNMITDTLPALSVVLQKPEHRHLSQLAREGEQTFDARLRRVVLRRGLVTAIPSLGAYLFVLGTTGNLTIARTAAFTTIVGTQLAQTLDSGWSEGQLTLPVAGAVSSSVALMAGALLSPGVRALFELSVPTSQVLSACGAGAVASLVLNRALAPFLGAGDGYANRPGRTAPTPATIVQKQLPAPAPVAGLLPA